MDTPDMSEKDLDENAIMDQMQEWLTDCDRDTLAKFVIKKHIEEKNDLKRDIKTK